MGKSQSIVKLIINFIHKTFLGCTKVFANFIQDKNTPIFILVSYSRISRATGQRGFSAGR